jgi:two-component system sensor histidine kinase KdpD
MHGTLQPEDTPGGGLTMVVSMPAATSKPADTPVPGRVERGKLEAARLRQEGDR